MRATKPMLAISLLVAAATSARGSDYAIESNRTYSILVVCPTTVDRNQQQWTPTFTDYLTATVGAEHNVSFESTFMDIINFGYLMSSYIDQGSTDYNFDFVFADVTIFVCLENLGGATAIASLRRFVNDTEFSSASGVIFTRSDRDDLTSLHDIKGRRVSLLYADAGSLVFMMAAADSDGIDSRLEASQQIINFDAKGVALDVIYGENAEFGVLGSGELEYLVEIGFIPANSYKILRQEVVPGGFPFASSTVETAPSFTLAAMPWALGDLSKAVADALMDLSKTDSQAIAANYSTWDTPLSHAPVTDLMEGYGFFDDDGDCVAFHVLAIYEVVECPSQYERMNMDLLVTNCDAAGLTCPYYALCVCQPCVEVAAERLPTYMQGNATACTKMGHCAVVQQLEELHVQISDSWSTVLDSLNLTAVHRVEMIAVTSAATICYFPGGVEFDCAISTHFGGSEAAAQAAFDAAVGNYSSTNGTYHFSAALSSTGLVLIEMLVNAELTDNSPIIVTVESRDCSEEVGGGKAVADLNGICVCPAGYRMVSERCVAAMSVGAIVGICVGGLVALGAAALGMQAYRKIKSDALWQIPREAVVFSEDVLGRGTYGVVTKASYRGVDVAVKQMHEVQYLGGRTWKGFKALFGRRPHAAIADSGGGLDMEQGAAASSLGIGSGSGNSLPRSLRASANSAANSSISVTKSTTSQRTVLPIHEEPTPPGSPAGSPAGGSAQTVSLLADSDRVRATDMSYNRGSVRVSRTSLSGRTAVASGLPGSRNSAIGVPGNRGSAIASAQSRRLTASGNDVQLKFGTTSNGSGPRFAFPAAGQQQNIAPSKSGALMSGSQHAGSKGTVVQRLWRRLSGQGGGGGTLSFYDEMKILSTLRHPNILTIMGAVVETGKPMLCVMELMDRGSLFDLLHNASVPIEPDMVAAILKDVACGMTFLHESGILHNDLKSHNILIDGSFKGKVADLGLATYTKMGPSAGGGSKNGGGGGSKGDGRNSGTPYWMAPEKLRGERASRATDAYSFGITIYECLSRKEPYEEYDDPYEVLRRVADPERKDPDVFRPTVPEFACKVMIQMMMEHWSATPSFRPQFRETMQRIGRLEGSDANRASGEAQTCGMLARKRLRKRAQTAAAEFTMEEDDMDDEDDVQCGDLTKEDAQISGLPRKFAIAVRSGRATEQESFAHVCCVFTDIVGYSALSSKMKGDEVIDMLDRLYAEFDKALRKQHMYNVDIIGDAYMAVSGLLGEDPLLQVERVCNWCVDAVKGAQKLLVCPRLPELGYISIRAGLNAGPCAAGVVGKLRPRFSLFGDTINVAARMESLSRENCVQLSAAAANILLERSPGGTHAQALRLRGDILVKGKGTVKTFFLVYEGGQDPFKLLDHSLEGK